MGQQQQQRLCDMAAATAVPANTRRQRDEEAQDEARGLQLLQSCGQVAAVLSAAGHGRAPVRTSAGMCLSLWGLLLPLHLLVCELAPSSVGL